MEVFCVTVEYEGVRPSDNYTSFTLWATLEGARRALKQERKDILKKPGWSEDTIEAYYESYDPCEEAALWIGEDGHGRNGAPHDLADILDDMKKSNLTPEQQTLFNANFNRRAYDKAKEPIQKAMSESKTFDEFWERIKNYDRDVEFDDDFTIITCEVELDRSHMETEGDYVGVCFYIKQSDETNTGTFDKVALFSSEPSGEYIADLLCYINPETCEVTEWVYEA